MKWTIDTPEAALRAAPAPQVLITVLEPDNVEVSQSAAILYRELGHRGVRAVLDERALLPAVKLAAADRLAPPLVLVIGEHGLRQGSVELRRPGDRKNVRLEEAVGAIVEMMNETMNEVMPK